MKEKTELYKQKKRYREEFSAGKGAYQKEDYIKRSFLDVAEKMLLYVDRCHHMEVQPLTVRGDVAKKNNKRKRMLKF